jgi:hypothetical protein
LDSLSGFEESLLGFAGDPRTNDILSLLDVVISQPEHNGLVIPPRQLTSSLTIFDFQKICSVLCAYRFFEVISLQAECVSRVSPPFPMSMYLPGSLDPKDELFVRQ